MVKGQQSRYLYYVQEGGVEVSYTVRGTNIVVALMGPGEFFGEIGFFDKIARVRDIRATDNATIRIFDDNALQRMQRKVPILYGDFLDLLLRNVCTRFRRILSDREPLTAYAASLSQGRHSFDKSLPIPEHLKYPKVKAILKHQNNRSHKKPIKNLQKRCLWPR